MSSLAKGVFAGALCGVGWAVLYIFAVITGASREIARFWGKDFREVFVDVCGWTFNDLSSYYAEFTVAVIYGALCGVMVWRLIREAKGANDE